MRSENSNIQIKQELVNSIVHGFGIIFGVVSIPILIALAIKSENMAGIVSRSIWLCFLQLFTFSTLYHGIQHTQAKHTLEILDHISIYFLIAGTYTVLLMYMLNSFGITLLSVLWGLTVLGIIYTIFFLGKWKVFQR
jgi:hemolysin III